MFTVVFSFNYCINLNRMVRKWWFFFQTALNVKEKCRIEQFMFIREHLAVRKDIHWLWSVIISLVLLSTQLEVPECFTAAGFSLKSFVTGGGRVFTEVAGWSRCRLSKIWCSDVSVCFEQDILLLIAKFASIAMKQIKNNGIRDNRFLQNLLLRLQVKI